MKKLKLIISTLLLCVTAQTIHAQTTLVTPGSSWKYLDNGSNQGTAWRGTGFSDASWASGNAQLGYGDGDEATVVSYGPNSSNKYRTTYFRKTITVADASIFSGYTLKARRDDGIVVYINGVEKYRNNMPTGSITYTTNASTACSDDGATWQTTTLASGSLATGTNVIAVEIHQNNGTSSDISFDFELLGTGGGDVTPPTVSIYSPADNATGVSNSANLVLTFNENIQKGAGNILVKEGGVITQTIAVTAANVTVSGTTATIDPADFTFSAAANIEIAAGAFKDMANNNYAGITNATTWNFAVNAQSCANIGCFTSVQPAAQTQFLEMPATHKFQMLFKQGNTYTVGGSIPGGHDFTGYVPISGSSTNGYVNVNHENSPGGVSTLDVNYDSGTKLWSVTASQPVSFSASSIVKTERNCSGAVTPWGTTITCEETRNTGDANGDGYIDVGWNVEIDPATRQVKQYGNGFQEKLWAMGRMNHENAVVHSDQRTVYYGEDAVDGCVYKYVANTAGNLYAGTLYVLKLNSALSGGEPTSSIGTWVQVPNTTQSDRNSTYSLAVSLAATQFNGVEDVEISPNGQIYFTSKGHGRVYRFTDGGTSVSGFETYVGGTSYTINYGSGSASEAWGTGNDNLAFDGDSNLWVLQDGGRGHLWMVKNGHTQASPKVELFAKTPAGSEPTGITFTPDYKYMFVSLQHPSGSNGSQTDASGASVSFNAAATIVIARSENLGTGAQKQMSMETNEAAVNKINVYPNPSSGEFNIQLNLVEDASVNAILYTITGVEVQHVLNGKNFSSGKNQIKIDDIKSKGIYLLKFEINGKPEVIRLIIK